MSETNDKEDKNNIKHFGLREGHLFLIDVSPDMFERDPDNDQSYFEQCIEAYKHILSQKLRWNRKHWMGLVFFNSTKDWDHDPKTELIKTVQKFKEIDISMLSGIMEILKYKNNKEDYWDETLDISLDDCLYDVFWLACRSFDPVNVAMPVRQIFLLTCRDNPLPGNSTERHRIRQLAKNCSNLNIDLRVIGLGKNWNHDLFYKDIAVLANNLDPDDFKQLKINDLELQVMFPARASDHLDWKIGGDVKIPMTLQSFSSKTQYLKKTKLNEETNEILEVYRHWGPTKDEFGSDEEKDDVDADIPDSVESGMSFGNTLIKFSTKEVKAIRAPFEKGIQLLGFKPLSIDLIYYVSAPRFGCVDSSASEGTKSLFAALLKKCNDKDVMAICRVSNRTRPYLVNMISCMRLGGFYLFRIPFKENVNTLKKLEEDICNNELAVQATDEGIQLMTAIVEKLGMDWDPWKFRNPKLNHELAYIEALALDDEFSKPEDTTKPHKEVMITHLGNLTNQFENLFGDLSVSSAPKRRAPVQKRPVYAKLLKFDKDYVRNLIKDGKLQNCTQVTLKEYARSLGLPTSGLKINLVERITTYFSMNNDED